MPQWVLIADDSAVVRLTVARRIRAAGLDVIEHDSAASAVTADATTLICALLDFDLGDGFGSDVAAHLRAVHENLPIAFFTSTSTPDVTARAASFGPIFAKPDDLDAAIARVTHQPR